MSIAKLGRLIVAELELEETNNTLGRWMAHRIAELMTLAENTSDETARENARQKCTETITKLWEARLGWPRGNPLANLTEYLQAFKQFNTEYNIGKILFSDTEDILEEQLYQEDQIEKGESTDEEQIEVEINPLFKLLLPRRLGFFVFEKQAPTNWLAVFLRVVDLNLQEERVLRNLALTELSLEGIQDWLDNVAEFFSIEEQEVIEILQKQKAASNSFDFNFDNTAASNSAVMTSEQRAKMAQSILQKISKEREQTIMGYLQSRLEQS